jgi:SSS family solute:Na+ symporter
MHTASSIFVVAAYAAVLTFVAVRARAAREFSQFSLADRALPLALIFGSLCATYVGPVFSIGFVGKGYASGFLFLGIGLAYSVQNVLVGLLVAPRLRGLRDCHTLGDAIGQKYDRKCHVLAGVISVGLCAGFAAVMAKAGGIVLSNIFELPIWSSVIIVVGVTALYTTFGGLRASVVTDAFQFTAFAIFLPVMLLFVLVFRFEGGATTFVEQVSSATSAGMGSVSLIEIVGLIGLFLLGETLIPPYANRALASGTTRISRNGFIMAGGFSVIWFMVMVSLGVTARVIVPSDTPENSVLLELVRAVMPAEGYALLSVVLVSVIMSSLDSLLNAGAVAFSEDVVRPFVDLPNGSALNIGRCATVIIAAVAAAGALVVPSLVTGLLACYAIWAPAILPALIIGLWIKRPRPLAGILSMVVGTVVALMLWLILWAVFKFVYPREIEIPPLIIVPALAAALLAYAVGHWGEKIRSGS